jgi:putative DNA primase/helicase
LLLLGTGANGKSVVFEILTALFGEENISHYSLHSLQREYYRAMIGNKLLNYASEISTRLESDIFKKLSSGEPCEARLPYGKPFLVRDYARLAFNCNELPRDVEHTNAFFRRFLIIKFDVTIPEEKRNPKLADEIIETELSGVFNWLLDGLQRLLKQGGFSECQAIQTAVDEYRHSSDSVAIFIEEVSYKQVSDRDKGTLLREIYTDYKSFCQDYNFRPVSIQNLSNRLRALGMECLRTNKGILVLTKKSAESLHLIESPSEIIQELTF